MSVLRARAPGKVNLCLFVGEPREDGLHPLVSVVQALSLADELTLEPPPMPAATGIRFAIVSRCGGASQPVASR